MKTSKVWLLGITLAMTQVAVEANAAVVIAGDLQTEQGNPGDWDPPNSTLIMTEGPSGFFSQTAVNLTNGAPYEFKALEGTPPVNWGAPTVELTTNNIRTYGDSDNSILITLDKNNLNVNGAPTVWVESDAAPFQVVGDFQSEAGGAGDWNPADPLFAMTNAGGGYYTFLATISTPGSYQFKATYGAGWDHQVGPDGYSQNSGTFAFSTTTPGEQVLMFVDTAGRSIGVAAIPEPASLMLGLGGMAAMLLARRKE